MPAIIYSMAPAKFGTTVVPVERFGFSAGIVQTAHTHSGNEYATIVAVAGATPRITMSMPFRAAYDLFGLTVASVTTFEFYLAKFASLIRAAGSVHTKWALSASCSAACQITGFSVNNDGFLMAEVDVVPLSNNGTTHPLTRTDNNALLSLASQPVLHTLGPVSINGTVVPGLSAANGDLGQRLEVARHDGTLYPLVAARLGGDPKLTFTHSDPVTLESQLASLLGSNITSNVVAYFRGYNTTTGVNDTGTTAISITIASGRAYMTELPAQHGQIATRGLEVIGLSTSSTHPMVVATSATAPAIP